MIATSTSKSSQSFCGTTYELEVARTGEECLEKLPAFGPDLVLLDIMMPGIDGYEACRRIKASPVGSFTQVILVSGKASTAERLQGFEAGADDYVVKPFDHDELLAKIRSPVPPARGLGESLGRRREAAGVSTRSWRGRSQQRSAELVATRDLTIFALAKLTESRDPETGAHLERMRHYCADSRRAAPRARTLYGTRSTRSSSTTSTAPARCTTSARWASPTRSC